MEFKVTNALAPKYQGIVTVTALHSKSVLKRFTSHNTGTTNLSKFICNALAGQMTSKPCKIILYTLTDDSTLPMAMTVEDLFNPAKLRAISAAVPYSTPPRVIAESSVPPTDMSVVKTVLQWTVPHGLISDNSPLHVIGLFSEDASSNETLSNAYAYYLCKNESGTDWQDLGLENATDRFSLLVEWELYLT